MLIRKMFRDVWKNKVPFIAIFLMMFAGNFIFSGITSEYNGMHKTFHSYIKETNLADAWILEDNFQSSDIEQLKKKSSVEDVEKRALYASTLKSDDDKTIDLYVLSGENTISKINVLDGKKYSKNTSGIWLDATFAKENDYEVKDKIKLDIDGKTVEKEIVGVCDSPEYIYSTKDGEFVPDHKNNGFAFINETSITEIKDIKWNQLLVSGTGDLEKTLNNTLRKKDTTVLLQKDHTSYSMINDEITQHKEIGLIFVMVFLFIAILVTITTVHRLLNSQRLQIGILKSMGFHKRPLYIHYISHSTFVCLVGSVAGWCAGYVTLPKLLFPIMEEMYILPKLKPAMLTGSWMFPVVCALACLTVSLVVCHKYLKENTAKILYSNSIEKEYQELPLPSLWKHLSFYGQWNLRDIFRNKLRSSMTIFGVMGCVALLFSSFGLFASMNYMSEWTFDKVQTYDTKVTGDFSDEEFKNKLIQSMYGEELMETSAEVKFDGKEETVAFSGIESQDFLRLYDSEGKEIELEEGLALSGNTADKLGIEVGDRLKWKFAGSDEWYLEVVKYIVRTPMTQGITMLKSEMDAEGIPFHTTSIIGEKPKKSLTDSDYVDSVQHKADLKSALDTILNASVMLSMLFLVCAVLLGGVILYNLGTLSYMERYRDMATLKVLGFHNQRIRKLMIQQNIWLTIAGIVIGLPAGYGLTILMLSTVQDSIDIRVYIPTYVYIISVLGTFLLSWSISKFLSRKIYRIDMVFALKLNE